MSDASSLVLPRWEWRALEPSMQGLRQRLAGVQIQSVRSIHETYLLCLRNSHNAKIRSGIMDLKWRKQVDRQGLELWDPILKTGFPCEAMVISQFFGAWALPLPTLVRDTYTLEQFLQEVILPNKELKPLEVQKVREGFVLEGTTCEFATVSAKGLSLESFCVEHDDPRLVMNLLSILGLDSHQNVNYPMALKKALAHQAA